MKTTLTIKTDKELRDKAKKTAKELGVPLSTVMNAMLKQFVREKQITFSARTSNKATQQAIQEILTDKNTEKVEGFKDWRKKMRQAYQERGEEDLRTTQEWEPIDNESWEEL